MTGYADGQSVTTQYELDNGRVLAASAGNLATTYLYGLGPITELTAEWQNWKSDAPFDWGNLYAIKPVEKKKGL